MLLGPSGCGKTTTLRMIAGLELPSSGQILLDGAGRGAGAGRQARHRLRLPDVRALPAHERAPQHRLSAGQPGHGPGRGARAGSRRWRGILGITGILDRPVGGLSGGDRQRVALGRAIVREPKAFLMDEPLGALDAEFREHMAEELRALHDRMGATTVYVTHDQLEAMQMGDKIVVMNHGVVEQWGTPQEIYDRPGQHVRRRLHRLAADELPALRGHLPAGRRERAAAAASTVPIPPAAEGVAGRALALGVRPGARAARRPTAACAARCWTREYLGTTQIVTHPHRQRRR